MSAIVGAVVAAGVGVAKTPIEAWRKEWEARIRERIRRTREAADKASKGQPLVPSDRVAYRALTEASFTDAEIVSSYLGGVIAASGPNDDSGTPIVAQISRLSAHQLALHYSLYRTLRDVVFAREQGWIDARLPSGERFFYARSQHGLKLGVYWHMLEPLGLAGEGTNRPGSDFVVGQVRSLMSGLAAEGLVDDEFGFWVRRPDDNGPGEFVLSFVPRPLGAELFLWGHGFHPESGIFANKLFDLTDSDLEIVDGWIHSMKFVSSFKHDDLDSRIDSAINSAFDDARMNL